MKKTMLLLCLLAFNAGAQNKNYWKDGITMQNDVGKRCTAGVFNSDGAFFTFNVQNHSDKKEIFFEFKSSVDISNKGEIIADLDFYNLKKSKREDIRIKLKPYSKNDKRLFMLDTSVNTLYSIERMLDLMEKYQYFYMKTFDKQWVEYPFKFSLVGSGKQIKIVKKQCDFKF
jgi:hypothetical protein